MEAVTKIRGLNGTICFIRACPPSSRETRAITSPDVGCGPWPCLPKVGFAAHKITILSLTCPAINEYLPRIKKQIGILQNVVKRSKSQPLSLNDTMSFFAFDSMGDFVFNQSYGMMESGEWHKAIIQQRSALAILGSLHCTIWLIRIAFAFMPSIWRVADWFNMVAFCDERMNERLKVSALGKCQFSNHR